MGWRLAKSLQVLSDEIRAKHPGTTIWTIGDQSHAAGASDHNPNSAGVVCAIDVKGNAGLNLKSFAEFLKGCNHPAIKYVIHDRKIWSKSRSSEGWRHYGGSNPHRDHLHVSVGTGPDGKSTGPYDNTSSWGFSGTGSGPGGSTGSATTIGGIMLPREGDKGPDVEFWQRMLLRTGEKLPKYGADAAWGSEMTAAVQSSRKKLGWDPVKSPRITAAHAEQLLLKAFAAKPAPAPAVKRQD